jgi:hypothetical protein
MRQNGLLASVFVQVYTDKDREYNVISSIRGCFAERLRMTAANDLFADLSLIVTAAFSLSLTEALPGGGFVDRSALRFAFTCSARRSPNSCALSI